MKKLTDKQRNEACRSNLQDAIRSIITADHYWGITSIRTIAIIGQLKDLKADVKAALRNKDHPPRLSASARKNPHSKIQNPKSHRTHPAHRPSRSRGTSLAPHNQ